MDQIKNFLEKAIKWTCIGAIVLYLFFAVLSAINTANLNSNEFPYNFLTTIIPAIGYVILGWLIFLFVSCLLFVPVFVISKRREIIPETNRERILAITAAFAPLVIVLLFVFVSFTAPEKNCANLSPVWLFRLREIISGWMPFVAILTGGVLVYIVNLRLRKNSAELASIIRSSFLFVVILAMFFTIISAGLNSVRTKGVDARRLSDIKQMQAALELYFDANNGTYPKVSASAPAEQWEELGQALYPWMHPLPTDPCSQKGRVWSSYEYHSNPAGASYMVTFTLQNGSGSLSPGVHHATPKGVE